MTSSRKLTLDDIADARDYERKREQLRKDVLAIKQRRRVSLGTVVTLMFENRETMRHQVQEMARVERTFTDERIKDELAVAPPPMGEKGCRERQAGEGAKTRTQTVCHRTSWGQLQDLQVG